MFSNLFIDRITLQRPGDEEEDYIFQLPVVKHLLQDGGLEFKNRVTFFTGENGVGKSTLLEAIAVAWGFNAEGGTKNYNFASKETHSSLYRHMKISKGIKKPTDGFFLRAESFYNIASEVDRLDEISPLFYCYGGKSLHDQSHGEGFMSLILNRFGGNGLYIFDEPETALSPSRQMTLLAQINQLANNNSQFIISTHSPILLAFPEATIYVLSEDGIVPTPYEETEPYILTKQFLNQTPKILKCLLDE